MINCDGCGRLIKTTRMEIEGDAKNLCNRCLRIYARQGFIQLKITETQQSIDDAEQYLATVRQKPRVRANYERFLLIAQGNLARYQQGDLNEGELYRLEIENSTQGIADKRLFELHNT